MPSGDRPESIVVPVLSLEGLNLFFNISLRGSQGLFPYGVDPVLGLLFPSDPAGGVSLNPAAPPWLALRLHLHPALFDASGLPVLQEDGYEGIELLCTERQENTVKLAKIRHQTLL